MNLLIYKKGLGVTFDHCPGQVDSETVIALDTSNKYINSFSFKNIRYNDTELNEVLGNIDESSTIEVENGFLFYTFKYQISYQHFMSSTLPLLKEYIEKYPTYKLLVPEHYYNSLQEELFELFSIKQDQILYLKDNHMYKIKNFAERTWSDIAFDIDQARFEAYSYIRNQLGIINTVENTRKIYIQRDKTENEKYNNSNTGKYRKILNEGQLIEGLASLGFEIVTFGDKTLKEKKEILEGAKIVITAVGANCFNFIFAAYPETVYLLSNSSSLGVDYYTELIKRFNGEQCRVRVFRYNNITEQCDPTNQWNSPFIVNIGEIMSTLSGDT
jgi:capsular polysaccharide biosynthesis protein